MDFFAKAPEKTDEIYCAYMDLINTLFDGHDTEFSEDLFFTCLSIMINLIEKNIKYGNSALEPIGIFFKGTTIDGINARIDDKIKRMRNQKIDDEDAAKDLLGYLIIREIAKKRMGENR